MAADTREPQQPAELPKGIVLDKDGKPCRSCTSKKDFAMWSQMTRSSLKAGGGITAFSQRRAPADDCPADVEALGRSTWTLLHSIAATYPEAPNAAQQSDLDSFMRAFSRLYPCWVCAEDFQRYMAKEPIRLGSRDEFGKWLCEAHNAVNVKLGKDTFDCSLWEESTDALTRNLKKPVTVADYLFTRLRQVGISSVHGLPGDFNLVALDYLLRSGLNWVGNCNELNAAYAADGYARVKGIGAIVTTFGVGELSAVNGIAGAYSEHVPIVHIVGCPSTVSQRDGLLLHHTLGNGDFNVFADMSAKISCAVTRLNDPADIAAQIDFALRECYFRSRPVYIMLPTDMVERKIEGTHLDTLIDLSDPANDAARENYVVDIVLKSLHAAQRPVILVDACAVRHHVLGEVHDLIEKTGLPVFVTPMGKSAINEAHPSYGGVYAGSASHPDVKEMVESSDLVLAVGSLKSDFNTAGFSYRLSQLSTIDLHSDHCIVRYSEYPGVRMKGVLRRVVERLDVSQIKVLPPPPFPSHNHTTTSDEATDVISQKWLWENVGRLLREDDIVVTETGTANFGIWDTRFPTGVTALNQTLWGSIGWAVGACQGAALATKDIATETEGRRRRTILFEGDGSLQLSVQEVSTMIRQGLDVILFVICNEGYTIERFIHGMEAAYNDIAPWSHRDLLTAFGAGKTEAKAYEVRTRSQFEALLEDTEFTDGKGLRLVELYTPRTDGPKSMHVTAQASAKRNAATE
ncbi:thiamine diphosphate-binding protein [Durotheca rogersii]|uniref:thiamine diphosphate-binding protein n=1 Tax=Durotheca rogersii TaxID=419775 RepID=UPI00222005AA|nr:thiamine diphosphate-binding protein [Durotheca rogersii]KAI5859897.1 thiamine diphosphate-binding protein [Durotheca rogersii]